MPVNSELILEIKGISKSFGGVKALCDVDFKLYRGEVQAVIGENGAGKTTLMNILGGIIRPDSGILTLNGEQVEFESPQDACKKGIATIHQELTMLPHMTVMENIFMGQMKKFNIAPRGLINRQRMISFARESLGIINLTIDPASIVNDLSISERQCLEIVKALSGDPDIIIMDEPNSSLTGTETERLFEVIGKLTARGVAVIYVSHRIEEVLRIADRITVLRDGVCSGVVEKKDATVSRLFSMIAGRERKDSNTRTSHKSDQKLLSVTMLSGYRFHDISFTLFKGEILGLYGLVGSGRSELARTIYGADKIDSGTMILEDNKFQPASPAMAIGLGVAMVPEDRKESGLFMQLPVVSNMTISHLKSLSRFNFSIRSSEETTLISKYIKMLNIKLSDPSQAVNSLSGGNQQKVLLARNIMTEPRVLILDEPTHGVDVGAKDEIYQIIETLAENGIGIIFISSEMSELLTVSDRIAIMHEGRIRGILKREEATEEKMIAYATGYDLQVAE